MIMNNNINISVKGYIYFNQKMGGAWGFRESQKRGVMSKSLEIAALYTGNIDLISGWRCRWDVNAHDPALSQNWLDIDDIYIARKWYSNGTRFPVVMPCQRYTSRCQVRHLAANPTNKVSKTWSEMAKNRWQSVVHDMVYSTGMSPQCFWNGIWYFRNRRHRKGVEISENIRQKKKLNPTRPKVILSTGMEKVHVVTWHHDTSILSRERQLFYSCELCRRIRGVVSSHI